MDYNKSEYVKETGLSDSDMNELKEAFKEKYANEKGWDVKSLTSDQLTEIQGQEGFKKAGKLFS